VKFGLPELDKSRQKQGNEITARVDALLAMMTTLDDTCVLYRAGETGLVRMQQGLKRCWILAVIQLSLGNVHLIL
jgi:triphosphoribosyl-dephospho-CoA synthase